jgi:peroxiredoxin
MTRKAIILTPALLIAALICSGVAAEPFKLGGTPPRIDINNAASADADRQEELRRSVPEFPPGQFTDGGKYRLNDLAGKVVVLLFYDGADPRFAATAPNRAAIVRLFRDRPVAFFGVQTVTIDRAREDARRLELPMPVFADTLGVLAVRYRATLTPPNSWHVVIIDPEGDVSHKEMLPSAIESALKTAQWVYRDPLVSVDAKVTEAIDALEYGNYDGAARHINAVINGMDPKAAATARQILSELRAPALAWKELADRQVSTSPVAAYDLYARAALFLGGSDASKPVAEAIKRLETKPLVRSELAARVMLDALSAAVSRDQHMPKSDAIGYCHEIIRAHPATDVAQSLVGYLEDLGGAKDPHSIAVRRRRP